MQKLQPVTVSCCRLVKVCLNFCHRQTLKSRICRIKINFWNILSICAFIFFPFTVNMRGFLWILFRWIKIDKKTPGLFRSPFLFYFTEFFKPPPPLMKISLVIQDFGNFLHLVCQSTELVNWFFLQPLVSYCNGSTVDVKKFKKFS